MTAASAVAWIDGGSSVTRWASPQTLGSATAPGLYSYFLAAPALALDNGDRAYSLTGGSAVDVKVAQPGMPFGGASAVGRTYDSFAPTVIGTPWGVAAAWLHLDRSQTDPLSGQFDCCLRLQATTISPTGRASPTRQLSSSGDDGGYPRFGGGDGRIALAWLDPRGIGVSETTPTGFATPRFAAFADVPLAVWVQHGRVHILAVSAGNARARLAEDTLDGTTLRHRLISGPFGVTLDSGDPSLNQVVSASTLSGEAAALLEPPSPDGSELLVTRSSGGHIMVRALSSLDRLFRRASGAVAFAPSGRGVLVVASGSHLYVSELSDGNALSWRSVTGLPPSASGFSDLAAAINDSGRVVIAGYSVGPLPSQDSFAFAAIVGSGVATQQLLPAAPSGLAETGVAATIDEQGRARVAFSSGDEGVTALFSPLPRGRSTYRPLAPPE